VLIISVDFFFTFSSSDPARDVHAVGGSGQSSAASPGKLRSSVTCSGISLKCLTLPVGRRAPVCTAALPLGRTGNEPLSGHLVSSIADEELDSLMSQQSEAFREEQEPKQRKPQSGRFCWLSFLIAVSAVTSRFQSARVGLCVKCSTFVHIPASATCALDVDWTSLMATSGECAAAGAADSAAAGTAAELRGPERGVAPTVSALSHFNSVAVLSRIGVSRAHAGDERYRAIVQCISEAAEQGIEGEHGT